MHRSAGRIIVNITITDLRNHQDKRRNENGPLIFETIMNSKLRISHKQFGNFLI